MRLYELTYFLSSNLTESESTSFSEKISSFVQENEGLLDKNFSIKEDLGKRKLGSPIKKEGQAYLGVLNFYFNPEKVEMLKTKLNSENQILRYIILAKKELKKIKAYRSLPQVPKIEKKVRPFSEKVDLKEIEKKLEEILDE